MCGHSCDLPHASADAFTELPCCLLWLLMLSDSAPSVWSWVITFMSGLLAQALLNFSGVCTVFQTVRLSYFDEGQHDWDFVQDLSLIVDLFKLASAEISQPQYS